MRFVYIFIALLVVMPVYAANVDPKVMEAWEKGEDVPVVIMKDGEIQEYNMFRQMGALSKDIGIMDMYSILSDPSVTAVQLDKPVKAFLAESASLINATGVWPIDFNGTTVTGKGQTVCVIDTGIDYIHPAIAGSFLGGYNYCVNENCSEESSDPMDNHGHGTHVAGIVVSNDSTYRGVAPDAGVVAIKALNSQGNGWDSDVLAAIGWCIANATEYNITVISMSLGGGHYSDYCDGNEPVYSQLINTAVQNNISVVIASGNDAYIGGISAPACIENATSVGAVYDDDIGTASFTVCTDVTTHADKISCFTDRNHQLDLLAPGSEITSTVPGGFANGDGTSMATPFVSGASILLRQYKELDNGTILKPLEMTAIFNKTGKLINDEIFTFTNFSRIDILAAISYVTSADAISPIVQITSPENRTYNTKNITLGYTATDNVGIDSCLFTINDTQVVCENASLTVYEGTNNITLFVNDTKGNNASDEVFFSIDTVFPVINITEPQNATYMTNMIDINYTVEESNIDRCWYDFNGTVFLNNGTGEACENTSAITPHGYWNLTIYVNDTAGNLNWSTVFFTGDILYATIWSPIGPYNMSTLFLNYSVYNMSELNQTWYVLDNESAVINGSIWFNATEGEHNLTVSVTDVLGRYAEDVVMFIVDTIFPELILFSPENITYSTNFIEIDFNVSEQIDCYAEWIGGNTTLCHNMTINNSGTNYLKLWVYDQAGNMNFSEVNFTVDIMPPELFVYSPLNISYNNTIIDLDFNASAYDSCWVEYNHTIMNCTNVTFVNLTEGLYNMSISVNDSLGNVNTSRIFFSIDLTAPSVAFLPPTPHNQTVSVNTVTIAVATNGSAVLEWNNDEIRMNDSSIAMNPLSNGQYNFRVRVNDSAGNVNYTEHRWVVVNLPAPAQASSGGGGGGTTITRVEEVIEEEPIIAEEPVVEEVVEEEPIIEDVVEEVPETIVNDTAEGEADGGFTIPIAGLATAISDNSTVIAAAAVAVGIFLFFRHRKAPPKKRKRRR